MAEFVIGIIELRCVCGDPRQRHTAAVTAFFDLLAHAVERGGIFQLIPRDIRDFRQSQFFALIDVGGSRQGKFHKNRGTSALGAQFAVLLIGGTVAQQPILGQLMMRRGWNLRQSITAGVTRHVVVAHHPSRGGAGTFRAFQAFLDGQVHVVANPVLLGELEVEHLSELFGRSIQILAVRIDPGFGHGECRRIVLVEHLAPLAVDIMHLITVIQRVRPVRRKHMLADLVAFEVVAVKILGEAVRHVHAEAVRTMVEPEAQRLDEVGAHLGVLPVPVRLLLGEHVQIPLAVRNARPRRTAEACDPISRRLVAVRALAVAEDVAVAFRGAWGGREGGLEPFVQVGAVVRHDVDHDLDAVLVGGLGELVEIVHGAELRVDVAVIVHVVAAVGKLGRVERAQPDGVHAEFGEVVDLLGDACDAAQARTAGVLEGTRVHLIHHGLLPPQRRIGSINFLLHHMFSLSFASLQNDSGYISSNYR